MSFPHKTSHFEISLSGCFRLKMFPKYSKVVSDDKSIHELHLGHVLSRAELDMSKKESAAKIQEPPKSTHRERERALCHSAEYLCLLCVACVFGSDRSCTYVVIHRL